MLVEGLVLIKYQARLYFTHPDRHCYVVFSVNCVIEKDSVIDDEFFEIGVGKCDFKAVMNLIMKGTDVNIRFTTGDALLNVTQSKEVGKLLIDNGADLSTRDKDYEFNQCVCISEILIAKGADANRGDNRLKGLSGVDGQGKIR